jgi:hypothetical protein
LAASARRADADGPDAPLLAGLRRLRDNLALYAPECLKIRDKDGKIRALRFNRVQQHLHERLEAQKRRIGRVRVIIGKGRQTGGSTYIAARFYHRTSMRAGLRTFILTHAQDGTDNLFEMVTRFHEHNPLRPSTGASNAKELFFDLLDSGYAVGTAATKATGRSQTIQLLHWSEMAHSANASGHKAGVVQTVPDSAGTEIVKESTGNGPTGEFYADWQQAEAGIGDYEAIFVPWYWAEEYDRPVPEDFALDEEEREYQALFGLTAGQMAWRRAKIQDLKDPKLFRQEYPATANEMFQATGTTSFVDPEHVMAARKRTCEGIGPLIVGVDPGGRGLNGRMSVAWRRGRKVIQVESRSGIGTMEAVAWLKDIIDQTRPVKMFMDVGGGGDRLFDVMDAWGEPYSSTITLVNFGDPAHQDVIVERDGTRRAGPLNRRAQMWERSKQWLEQPGGADIPDLDSLQSDACAPGSTYRTSDAKLVLESKEQLKQRGIRSPDEWDAVALTFAEPVADRRPRPPPRVQMQQASADVGHGWMAS